MTNRLSSLPLALLLAPIAAAQQPEDSVPADLAKAKARAEVHNERVLVIGCAEDQDLHARLKSDRDLRRTILYEFEVVQFAGGEAAAEWCLDDGGAAFTLLTAKGERLQRLAAADYVHGEEVDAEGLLQQWKPHFCAPVDAEKKLEDALAEAKKSGRNVFVRFDAPW